MSKILVVDTETTSVNKKFCYDIGYVIANIDDEGTFTVLEKKNFLVKQVWRNTMLFSTAYYAEKKPIYTKMLRNKKDYDNISVLRYDEIMSEMQKSIDCYGVEFVYAYNSSFDEDVFNFNCNWFRVENPLAELPFYDIRAYFMNRVFDSNCYKAFCEKNECFTESGNYSTTAETAYRYITDNTEFIEAHTALNDAEIELEILSWCSFFGENISVPTKAPKGIERKVPKTFVVKENGNTHNFNGYGATWYKKRNTLVIK